MLDQGSNNQTMASQMVVIGGGGAGMAAALTAVENRLSSVIVLEKRKKTGGTSAMASGPLGVDSPAQKRQGILTDKEQILKRMMVWTHLQADARILRAFIEKSGETIGWLENKGLWFECVPHSPLDHPLTWHVPRGDGAEIMRILEVECQKLGVRILTFTGAERLLQDTHGRITGVVASWDGRSFKIETQAAVIATGGYAGNAELLERYCPPYYKNLKLAGLPNQGDGLRLAIEAGADRDGLGKIMAAGPVSGGVFFLGEGARKVRVSLNFISGEAFTLIVNKTGRRFMDETGVFNYYESINALVRQPEGIAYALLDAEMLRKITREGFSNVPSGFGYGPAQRSPLPSGLEEKLKEQAEGGQVKVTDSWDEMAVWMGAQPEVLRSTLFEYNAACGSGADRIMGKDQRYLIPLKCPPFYAIRCSGVMLNTLGGIKVNEKMEVMDEQGAAIAGLYAAGVDTGGWSSDTYCAALPGTALGYALNSGRIAGESASRFVLQTV